MKLPILVFAYSSNTHHTSYFIFYQDGHRAKHGLEFRHI